MWMLTGSTLSRGALKNSRRDCTALNTAAHRRGSGGFSGGIVFECGRETVLPVGTSAYADDQRGSGIARTRARPPAAASGPSSRGSPERIGAPGRLHSIAAPAGTQLGRAGQLWVDPPSPRRPRCAPQRTRLRDSTFAEGPLQIPVRRLSERPRCGLLAAESRAGQRKYHDIELAVAHLHGMLEALRRSAVTSDRS
jgi:hypothetical protein